MFFAGPVSAVDQLQFNAHRIYGFVRLPLLTANWDILGVYHKDGTEKQAMCGVQTCHGLYEYWKQAAPPGTYDLQPVIVMRNSHTSPCNA